MNTRLSISLLLFACPLVSLADEYHNINQIVGDRAMGLAGAYTAVSDDPAGLFYNPAGMAYADSSSISASVNTLQYQSITYDEVLADKYDWERKSTQLLPNFFGVIQPLGPFKVGIASSIPDSVSENQDQQFEDFGSVKRYVINLNNRDIRYNFGPGLAYEINDQVSIGLTLNYHYRVFEKNFNQYIRFDNDDLEWSNSYQETKEHGIRPKLGIMWSPMDNIALGLTLDRTWVFNSETRYQAACYTTAAEGCGGDPDVVPGIQTLDNQRTYPWQLRTGAAWFANPSLMVTADLIYHTGVEESFLREGAIEPTLDVALGAEYYLNPRYALRCGYYTARANTKDLEYGKEFQEPHLDLHGFTTSLSRFTQSSSVTFGLTYASARGKSQLIATDPTRLQDTELLDISAFVSTSYRY